MEEQEKRPRVTGTTRGKGRDGSVTISGLSSEEVDRVEGTLNGQWWMAKDGDTLAFVPGRAELPKPAEDEDMTPFWRAAEHSVMGTMQTQLLDPEIKMEHSSPSFIITSLCGYNYTPERYRIEAERLEGYGFQCMRSRRDKDSGQYWENWYLPGIWSAKGALKEAFPNGSVAEVKKIVAFLCKHASFGSLDVVVQRAAMIMD